MLQRVLKYVLALCCIIEATYIPANVLVGVQAPYLYGRYSVITTFFYLIVGLLLLAESIEVIINKYHHTSRFLYINIATLILVAMSTIWAFNYNDHATPSLLLTFILNVSLLGYSLPKTKKTKGNS